MADEAVKQGWKSLGDMARTVISVIGVFTVIGTPTWKYVLAPALVISVSTAMAQDIDKKINDAVDRKLGPINTGLKALIIGNIAKLRERIDILEYKRTYQSATYTEVDRQELFRLNQELSTQQTALDEIARSEQGL